MKDQPVFEFTTVCGKRFKIYANGNVQGDILVGPVINRIPQLIAEAHYAGTQGKKEF